MFNMQNRGLPKAPPWAAGRTAEPGELTGAGIPWSQLQETLPPPQPQEPEQNLMQGETGGLPTPPPSAKKSGPFSKENLSQTLLDIGAGFLSGHNFSDGLGAAGKALSGRFGDLQKEAKDNRPKIEYAGPDNRFEITTGPNGERTMREVPEFKKVLDEKAKADRAPKAKDVIDQRARALHAISQLPEADRPAAYASLMTNPDMYGGVDTNGMPPGYDPTYATVMGNMGTTVNQSIGNDRAERALKVRTEQGERRLDQGQQRIDKPPASRRAPQTKPPAGFIWQ